MRQGRFLIGCLSTRQNTCNNCKNLSKLSLMEKRSFSEYLSEDGYRRFEEELRYLVKEKRKEISGRLEMAISLGDLSENAEYQDAKEAQVENESRITELEDLLSRSVILPKNENETRSFIEIGCTVVLERSEPREVVCYVVVSPGEADVLAKKISSASPLGISLLGRKHGEKIEVLTPKGKIEYTIKDIK